MEALLVPSPRSESGSFPESSFVERPSIGPAPSVRSLHHFAKTLGVDLFESARGKMASVAGQISRKLSYAERRATLEMPPLDLEKQAYVPAMSEAETLLADYTRKTKKQQYISMALCGSSALLYAAQIFTDTNSSLSNTVGYAAGAACIGALTLSWKAQKPYTPKSPYRALTARELEYSENCGFDREGFAQHLRNYLAGKLVPVDTDSAIDIHNEEYRMAQEAQGVTAQDLLDEVTGAYDVCDSRETRDPL